MQVERAEGRWGGIVERRFRNPAVSALQTPWGELCLSALGVVGESRSVKSAPDLLRQQQIEVLFTPIMLWRITHFCALSFAPAKNGLAKFRVGRQFHDQFLGPLASGWF